jgi:glutamate-1-semialdehyde 2,1-aminomutase
MSASAVTYALGALAGMLLASRVRARIELSRAKHPSLAGHTRLSRRLARLVPFYEYDEARFFRCDDAPDDVVARRRAGFERLALAQRKLFARTRELTASLMGFISDLQFTAAYRVPFQFRRRVREHLGSGSFATRSEQVTLIDLDGNTLYDLGGAYGVNLLGYDVYKECIERGAQRVRDLGPVLGPYHPLIAENVERLRAISGLDEVSFHMSGTEAVMQAVRLARYHTRRSHLVRFCGAYHGWWEDVQPGAGSPTPTHETYTLRDMDPRSLRVLRRRRDIACVLVNPLQALHPNAPAPSDAALVSGRHAAGFDRSAYTDWLKELRAVCSERGIVLIFDEVFVGFRLAPGGAQEYFGVRADIVTYGKTLGGGLPVGVVCGRGDLMKRYREDRPLDVCFARGTFNSHPYVLGVMNEFLRRLDTPEVRRLYADLDAVWDARARRLDDRLREDDVPVRVANLSSIWTVFHTRPSRYHWMFQYYLRQEGLALGWVGTGRFIFSLAYQEEDFDVVADRFVAAARTMREDGWWWAQPGATHATIGRRLFREALSELL